MTPEPFAVLRAELASGNWRLLYQELRRVVIVVSQHYAPQHYANSPAWDDEAIEDALQGWAEKRLVGRGDLALMLARAQALAPQRRIRGLRTMLQTSLRQYLITEAAGGSSWRLYGRSRKMLNDERQFIHVAGPPREAHGTWALEGGRTEASALRMPQLVRAAHELDDGELNVARRKLTSRYADPILFEPDLRRFLVHVLTAARGSLSLGIMHDVVRRRFNLGLHEAPTEVDDLTDHDVEESRSAIDEYALRKLAGDLHVRLGTRERAAVMALHRHKGKAGPAAKALQIEPGEFRRLVGGVVRMVGGLTTDDDTGYAIYDLLLEALFQENREDHRGPLDQP